MSPSVYPILSFVLACVLVLRCCECECEFWVKRKVQNLWVVLSGISLRLFCFVQATPLCRYGCMYFLTAFVHVCLDVMSSAYIMP